MAIIKKKEINVGEHMEKREPLCTAGGNVNRFNHYEKQYGVSLKKLKIQLPYISSNSISGYLSEGNESRILKGYLYSHVYCSIISQQPRYGSKLSVCQWMNG